MRRKLTAILAADIAGYSALMERDEAGVLARVKAQETHALVPRVAAHGGRIVKLMGDGALAEFDSVVAAVLCALELQAEIAAAQAALPEEERILYRIGVNVGDVIVEGEDIYGSGVNIAARLQEAAAPGAVAITREVHQQIAAVVDADFEDRGERQVKNLARPLHIFATRGAAPAPARAPGRISICVLPFTNMSGDPEQDYFADGVTEDIITDLSKVSSLAVASRNTAFRYKGQGVDIGEVARQLRCAYVLEGSVRKAGARVRITAQLIDAAADTHVWAERYDRDLSDIFALQSEISAAIVAALRASILPEEKRALESHATTNADAYKLFLMARQYSVLGSERTDAIIIRLCRRAVDLDPNYARAWALMAITQTRMHYRAAIDDDGALAAALALDLDPNLAEAHAAHGRVLANRKRYDEAVAEHETALRLDPDSYEVQSLAGRTFTVMHRHADAIRCLERAHALVPHEYVAVAMTIQNYEALGDIEGAKHAARRALTQIERIIAQEPDHGTALGHGVGILALLGETHRALDWAERAMLLDPSNRTLRYNLACAMVKLGEIDRALDYLEAAMQDSRIEAVTWAKEDTDLARLHDHPRYRAIMQQTEARLQAEARGVAPASAPPAQEE